MLFISCVLFYNFYQLLDAELGLLLLEITSLTAISAPPVKECAHTDWAAGLVLSHPLSLQRVFPIAKVILQH